MLKTPKRNLFSLLAVLFAVAVLSTASLAQKASEELFAKEGLEYHFLLSDVTNVPEKDWPKLTVQMLEQLSPMFVIDPIPKPGSGIYVDTEERILKSKNLILRVRAKDITLKARGPAADSVLDLKKCDQKKYEIDYFGVVPEYSISTYIDIKKGEFDTSLSSIATEKLLGFIEGKCPAVFEHLKPVAAKLKIPGATSQYTFKGKLKKEHPLADVLDIEFSIWFFPPTNRAIMELSYEGEAKDKAVLDKLQAETMEFLKKKGLLNADQSSKTESYFRAYFGR